MSVDIAGPSAYISCTMYDGNLPSTSFYWEFLSSCVVWHVLFLSISWLPWFNARAYNWKCPIYFSSHSIICFQFYFASYRVVNFLSFKMKLLFGDFNFNARDAWIGTSPWNALQFNFFFNWSFWHPKLEMYSLTCCPVNKPKQL